MNWSPKITPPAHPLLTWKWRNPYIDRLSTLPHLILACAGRCLSADEAARLTARLAEFKNCLVELGSGSGEHLLELARRDPTTLCIGFELRFKRLFRTAEKAEQHGISNILMVHLDARAISDILPPNRMSAVYMHFPEPWTKARWIKHRLMTPDLMKKIVTILKPGGTMSCKTDQPGYAAWVAECISGQPELRLVAQSSDLYSSEHAENNIPTEFERLFCSQGLPIHYVRAKNYSVLQK